MGIEESYLSINKTAWNSKTPVHYKSAFYDNEAFLKGKNSLKSIELELLGDIIGKKILHLQCHFGQDSISMARMGADVTGVDLSDESVKKANELAALAKTPCRFIECDIYSLPEVLDEQFDIVFTSYGTIGWLPDMTKWAKVIDTFLKPGGQFIFAEFHPVVWMFDDEFFEVGYNYFNAEVIHETQDGTYTDQDADITQEYVMWNHDLGEVLTALLAQKLIIQSFNEFNYSPYDCFGNTEEYEPGKFRIKHIGNNIPMVYSLLATKPA
ncbi:MAG: ubiquinone/menaquinone biosynthesis C-methylase UbiE [Bacteroidia bacterium]|jgi:ubiquinone/menaquinone biosynthesis C-methylase UbiE